MNLHVDLTKYLDVVVSHYEENLNWLREASRISRLIYIYHKGDSQKKLIDYCTLLSANANSNNNKWIEEKTKWINLPNVGRDGHSILYHCIQLKNNINENEKNDNKLDTVPIQMRWTLFVQGSVLDHKRFMYPLWAWKNYVAAGFVIVGADWMTIPDFLNHDGNTDQIPIKPAKQTFTKYYEYCLQKPLFKSNQSNQSNTETPSIKNTISLVDQINNKLLVSYCNLFSVHNTRILAHSITFYERVIETLSQHANPAEGHYFERLILSIFGGTTPFLKFPFEPILS